MDPLQQLAIVVPVGPGDASWRELLPDLAALPAGAELSLVAARPESIPADFDARTFGLSVDAQWLVAPPGRATQQNAGARATTGRWLWFLHADSRLTRTTLPALSAALTREAPDEIGYFDLRFRPDGPALTRVNAVGAWLRSRLFDLPFGDQGLFLPRALFERLGGFDAAIGVGEDLDFVRRARATGLALRPAGALLSTSARRYAELGWARTTLRHVRLTWSLSRAARRRIRGAAA